MAWFCITMESLFTMESVPGQVPPAAESESKALALRRRASDRIIRMFDSDSELCLLALNLKIFKTEA
jgi:hypothetical protein